MRDLRRKMKELAEFPFTKINPYDFRVEIASDTPTLLTRVIITTPNPTALMKHYSVKVLQPFPHLGCVLCEVPAGEIHRLAQSDLVEAIQNDHIELDADHGVHRTNSHPRIMGPGVAR